MTPGPSLEEVGVHLDLTFGQRVAKIRPGGGSEPVLLVRALSAAGDAEDAANALVQLESVASGVGTRPVAASFADHAGVVTRGGGNPSLAPTHFEDAETSSCGVRRPYDAGLARIELSRALLGVDDPVSADREASAALRQLDELAAVVAFERAKAILRQLVAEARVRATRKVGTTLLAEDPRGVLRNRGRCVRRSEVHSAPSSRAKAGSHSATGAGSSSTML